MKVSIVPRGRAALGYSQSLPREVSLYSEEQLEHMVRMALGGRAAEEIVFGDVSTGAQNDMERVTAIAHQCVTSFGFSPRIGPLSFPRNEESTELFRPYSEATAQAIDEEVRARVRTSYAATLSLLRDRRGELDALAERLLAKEVVGVEDLVDVLGPRQAVEVRCPPLPAVARGTCPLPSPRHPGALAFPCCPGRQPLRRLPGEHAAAGGETKACLKAGSGRAGARPGRRRRDRTRRGLARCPACAATARQAPVPARVPPPPPTLSCARGRLSWAGARWMCTTTQCPTPACPPLSPRGR